VTERFWWASGIYPGQTKTMCMLKMSRCTINTIVRLRIYKSMDKGTCNGKQHYIIPGSIIKSHNFESCILAVTALYP